MNENIFPEHPDLDTEYLNDTYGDDPETAIMMFQTYLEDLPANLKMLQESLANKDVESFRHHIHKQKPSYSYVGLTDVSESFHQLQVKCEKETDLDTYEPEIRRAITRIESSASIIRELLAQLQHS